MAKLNPNEKQIIQSADRAAVISSLSDLLATGSPTWLAQAHRLHRGVEGGHAPGKSTSASNIEISEYLATCAPTHTLNGWVFLSRALNSYAIGDVHSAWHFAYYAELRAALSILAANGIGVFNEWNAVLDSNGQLVRIDSRNRPLGTHQMAWLALECWVKQHPDAFNVIGNSLKLKKVSLFDALKQLWPSANMNQAIFTWLSDWSFDISQGAKDRLHRNSASYNPHEIFPMPCSAKDIHTFFEESWTLLEPQPSSPFYFLDRHLFRLAIESVAKMMSSTFGLSSINKVIERDYGRLDQQLQTHLPKDFLTRKIEAANPEILTLAKDKAAPPITPTTIMSRSLLLLRLATGMVTNLLKDAGCSSEADIKFWIEPFGVQRGFWKHGSLPTSMQDLWGDIDVAIGALDEISQSSGAGFSMYDWMSEDQNGFPRIWEIERAGLWGMAA